MEGHEVRRVRHAAHQRRNIAVAHQNLGMRNDLCRIKRQRQIVRSVASARANDGADIVAREHVFQFACPALDRTGKVQIAIEDRLEIKRLITGAAKTVAARLQHFAVHVRRGRNNSHLVARTERARLDSRIVGNGNHLGYSSSLAKRGICIRGEMQVLRFARDDN